MKGVILILGKCYKKLCFGQFVYKKKKYVVFSYYKCETILKGIQNTTYLNTTFITY